MYKKNSINSQSPQYPETQAGEAQPQKPTPSQSATEPTQEIKDWALNAPKFVFHYLTSAELNGALPHWVIDKFYSTSLVKFFRILESAIQKTQKEEEEDEHKASESA